MKLWQKQFQLRKQKRREELTKLQMLEEQRMKRERTEIKREAEKEQRRLVKMQQEHEVTMPETLGSKVYVIAIALNTKLD